MNESDKEEFIKERSKVLIRQVVTDIGKAIDSLNRNFDHLFRLVQEIK